MDGLPKTTDGAGPAVIGGPSADNHFTSWVDSCVVASLLPPTPWGPAAAAINATIAKLIKPKLTNAVERQVLFEVLGHAFVRAQFADSEDNPLILLPPLMNPTQREHHLKRARAWLRRAVGEAVNAAKLLTTKELRVFDKHSRKIANAGLGQALAESDTLDGDIAITSASAAALLREVPLLKNSLGPRLVGRPLPAALRMAYWGHELHTDKDRLSRRVQLSGLADPRVSELHGLIERSAEAIFSTTPALRLYNTPAIINPIKDVLNLLYVFEEVFEPRYVLLALPLVKVFAAQATGTVLIAGGLAKLHGVGIFTKAWAVASADRVMEQLGVIDADLSAHLISATSKGGLDYVEFLQKVAVGGKERSAIEGVQALQSPTIFLRKWIGDAFVGILSEAAAFFAWDQCMLVGWHTFEDISLVLLLLLRSRLMATTEYAEVRDVLFSAPRRLFTKDICLSYQYFRESEALSKIPDMNTAAPPPKPRSERPSVVTFADEVEKLA